MRDERPDPEELLGAIRRAEKTRGRLRVFLGMCPGVGKTYAMLKAAREAQARGVHVLVGLVETHGRKETDELLAGLRILPRKSVLYKDATFAEFDLDAALAERPNLVLVDELAHTNAPGLRHVKRFQDIDELLNAGINVFTTINIQHVESRNDQVAQITGVTVRETVPDSVLESADQIEVVDLSPAELLHRLREGKVYLPDRVDLARRNFFKEEHLTALRELSLRFTAEKVDQDLHDQMITKGIRGPWNTNERLLVAISHSPYAGRLIRATRRMAYNLEAPWVALYVNTGETLGRDDREMLQKNIALARELGAEVITTADMSLPHAIQVVCRDKNVTQIVMGRPDRRFFRDIVTRGTILDQLVRDTSTIDVHVIRAERKPRFRGFHFRRPAFFSSGFAYYNTAWFLAALTAFFYALDPFVGYHTVGILYLLAIFVVSGISSRGPILFSALVSTLAWDFFFIPPRFTIYIHEQQDIITVLTFFGAALLGGTLTTRIRRQEGILRLREEQTRSLYELGKNLAEARTLADVTEFVLRHVERQFPGEAAVLLASPDGKLEALDKDRPWIQEKERAVAQWSFEHGKSAGWGTQTLSGARCLCVPLRGNAGVVGVFAYVPARPRALSVEQSSFLETALVQAAIAIERFQFSHAAENAKILQASERLHQTLLNSVSHELRTPITALIGSATALREDSIVRNPRSREALTTDLIQAAERLDRVVENLLDMSRIEGGTIRLKREWFEAGDLLRAVRNGLREEGGERIQFVESEIYLEGDFRLLQHAVSNLVLNALKYSGDGQPVEIQVVRDDPHVLIKVRDRGKGVPEASRAFVFDKFYRVPGSPSGGLGLGLSIVKSIVELHGGMVSVRGRLDGPGAEFEIRLPVPELPPELREIVG